MQFPQFTRSHATGAFLLACLATAAAAAPPDWQPVAPAQLAAQRGGFLAANGLLLSLGIERVVAINGVTVARTAIDIPDLAHMNAAQARETSAALSTLKLIQIGSGNMVVAAMPDQSPGGMVIQNTLNGQRIESRTLISASVNSADMLNTLQFHGNLSDALARAAGP